MQRCISPLHVSLIKFLIHLACENALGMENGAISDDQITASSQWNHHHAAIQGRLNFKAKGSKTGAWSARYNNMNQWLQIDLIDQNTRVTHVATQGRNDRDQWVTRYKLEYSNDGRHFQYHREQRQTYDKVRINNLLLFPVDYAITYYLVIHLYSTEIENFFNQSCLALTHICVHNLSSISAKLLLINIQCYNNTSYTVQSVETVEMRICSQNVNLL